MVNREFKRRIQKGEVAMTLKKMGSKKAEGPDGIPIEVWRCLGERGIEWLTMLFNKIWRSNKMPSAWRKSILVPLYKNKASTNDIVLIDETKVGVQQKLELWRDTLEARGFRLSRSKTEYMECRFSDNSDREAEMITFDGEVVHGSTFFRYLGSIIQKDGELDGDVAHRIKAGWLKWKSDTGILCDPDMPHRLKGKFYRTTIRLALLYGTECWAVKQCHVQKMNVAEMRMLRWMCGHTKKDRLRNEVIREKIRVASIEDKMMENRLRWFGHVRRRLVDASVRRLESWGTINIICPHIMHYGRIDADTNSLKFPLSRPCHSGEQCFLSYGNFTNSHLLTFYGFLPQGENPYDVIPLDIDVTRDEDPEVVSPPSDWSSHMVRGTWLSKNHGIYHYGLPPPLLNHLRGFGNLMDQPRSHTREHLETDIDVLTDLSLTFEGMMEALGDESPEDRKMSWDEKLAIEFKNSQRRIISSILTSCHAGCELLQSELRKYTVK
ncbi:hypothetical protein OROGR_013780 [Orobanche gracilis]